MTTPLWIQISGLALALSGWGKVLFDLWVANPRVKGRIFNIMRGQMPEPGVAGQTLTSFVAYLYLVNTRKNSIHLLDFELEAKLNGRWQNLQRVYGIHNVENLTFSAPDGAPITVENFSENLIYRKNQAAEFGKPLHGWIVFAGPANLHTSEIQAYRLTCADAYGKKHVFTNTPKDFANLYLLQDMAGISIPESARKP